MALTQKVSSKSRKKAKYIDNSHNMRSQCGLKFIYKRLFLNKLNKNLDMKSFKISLALRNKANTKKLLSTTIISGCSCNNKLHADSQTLKGVSFPSAGNRSHHLWKRSFFPRFLFPTCTRRNGAGPALTFQEY